MSVIYHQHMRNERGKEPTKKYFRTAFALGFERSSENPTRGVFMMTSVTSECSAKRAWVMGMEARSCSLAKV
jgi:hypothetical protein